MSETKKAAQPESAKILTLEEKGRALSSQVEVTAGESQPDRPTPPRMELKWIQRLIRLMEKGEVSELEIDDEQNGLRIRLRRGAAAAPPAPTPMVGILPAPAVASAPMPVAAPAPGPAAPAGRRSGLLEIKSPMVGTFYRSSSPESEPFVTIGAKVGAETVVCIVEAMKVMNEIKAETLGEVVEILVENGEPVEYGQPLFLVQPG